MTLISRSVLAMLVWAVFAGHCWAQRGIPVPRSVPRLVPVHLVIPGGWVVTASIVAAVGAVVGLRLGLAAWENRVVALLRILRTPPGEAPEEIRQAWVGVDLPLRRRQARPCRYRTVGVLSQQVPAITLGYAVDGRTAIEALASHSPQAAAWWREHAPHVLASGYQLWFPCAVSKVIAAPPTTAHSERMKCAHCHKTVRVPEEFFGRQVTCPFCNKDFLALDRDINGDCKVDPFV